MATIKNDDSKESSDCNNFRDEIAKYRSVQEAFGQYPEQIKLTDMDESESLELYCYTKCSNNEPRFVKECRGVILHGNDIVLKSFPYADEYNHTQIQELEQALVPFSEFTFYPAKEGTLLRLFQFNNKWYLCTHRKLSAFRSKWASKDTFGTLFKKALEHEVTRSSSFADKLKLSTASSTTSETDNILDSFQNSLDVNYQYMFLLRNGADNRIVCHPPDSKSPWVYHVGTFKDNKPVKLNSVSTGLPSPRKLNFLNIDELVDYINKDTDPMYTQGVVAFGPDNVQVKILHAKYQELFSYRGNEPSIKFRYLQVRMDKKMRTELGRLYPDNIDVFKDYENILYRVAESIYAAYVYRYIRKNFIRVGEQEFHVMKACHEWHLEDRQNNLVNLDKVIRVLNMQTATSLNHMIRRYKMEQLQKQPEKNPRSYPPSLENSPAITGMNGENIVTRLPLPKLN